MASIDCTKPTASTRFVPVGVRLAFVGWLFVVTDGAAFSPFSFLGDVLDGWMWHPVLVVFGLAQVLLPASSGRQRLRPRR